MCGELRDWMSEKHSVLANDDLGKDMRTVQALQRKHQVGEVGRREGRLLGDIGRREGRPLGEVGRRQGRRK